MIAEVQQSSIKIHCCHPYPLEPLVTNPDNTVEQQNPATHDNRDTCKVIERSNLYLRQGPKKTYQHIGTPTSTMNHVDCLCRGMSITTLLFAGCIYFVVVFWLVVDIILFVCLFVHLSFFCLIVRLFVRLYINCLCKFVLLLLLFGCFYHMFKHDRSYYDFSMSVKSYSVYTIIPWTFFHWACSI